MLCALPGPLVLLAGGELSAEPDTENREEDVPHSVLFDYQSDRHCAKTDKRRDVAARLFDYQSDRHCAKTDTVSSLMGQVFDYQSDRHCAKTGYIDPKYIERFDYQSDRHCAKTIVRA